MTGFVLLRVRAHRLLLAAALLTVLLTTSVLATFTAFTGAIGDAALRRTLQHQAADRATVEGQADLTGVSAADFKALDTQVRGQLAGAFPGMPATVEGSTRSGPYGLPLAMRAVGAPKSTDPDLTLLATFSRSRLTLVKGAWPRPAARDAAEVQVAMPQVAADALGVKPGRVIPLANRLGGKGLRAEVTGVFKPADPASPYWHLDPLAGRGVHTVAFTTYGPLLADPGTFSSGRVTPAGISWQAAGDFSAARASDIGRLDNGVRETIAALHDGRLTSDAQMSSALPSLLDALDRSLLVTRSTLLISALQLVILAGFALLLVAQLLAEERAGETSLLRARGGSRARIGRLAAGEALLLALPAALAAPLLAGPVTRMLAGTGAMARTGVRLGDGNTADAWLVAVCAALACALAVVVPALRSSGSYAAERAARSRRGALPGALQAGADIGLLVIAGVAYWQLQRRSSGSGALSANSSGGLGVDPVLVAAPALCLLAGTVLVLRLLPMAAKLGERRAARGRGLALALAGWQLSRRPRRGAGAALLLVLAVAMGMFAIGQSASWDRSQRDQADYAVGADLRVTGVTTPPFGQAGIYTAVPGVTAAAAAAREDLLLTQDRQATALAVDTSAAGKVMRLRSDLAGGRPVADLLRPLRTASAADRAGFTVPGSARKVTFAATLRPDSGEATTEPAQVTVTVMDGEGVPYDFPVGTLVPDGSRQSLVLNLTSREGTSGGAPAGPLRLVKFTATYVIPHQHQRQELTLLSAEVTGADGGTTPLASGVGPWKSAAAFDDKTLLDTPRSSRPSAVRPAASGSPLLRVSFNTGHLTFYPNPFDPAPTATLQMRTDEKAPPLAGIATDGYLKAIDAKVGDLVAVDLGGVQTEVKLVGSVRNLPGTGGTQSALASGGASSDLNASDGDSGSDGSVQAAGPDLDAGALLLDLRSVDRVLESRDARVLEPTEWWLSVKPGQSAKVAAALRARTDVDTVLVRDETAADLRADPLGAGPQSALPAAVVAAAVLAAVGFAVASVGAIRERTTEFAVLRALGAPRRKLARMIAAEQGLLVVVSLAVGVLLGALLTRLVTPLIVLTAQAAQPVPALLVVMPVGRLSELLAVIVAVPVLVVLATAVRRGDPATALRRQGED